MEVYADRLNVRLKKLKLQNFRGFRDIELALETEKNVTVLIADNGLGKTSLLDATAEFLRFFRHAAIYSSDEKQGGFMGEINPTYDVTNGTVSSTGQAILEIEYPFVAVELFEWVDQCISWLDEHEVPGLKAKLIFDDEESSYAFLITREHATEEGEEKEVVYLLPDELRQLIVEKQEEHEGVDLLSLLDAELRRHSNAGFEIAQRVNGQWELSLSFDPTSFSSIHRGEIELKFEMNSTHPDSLSFKVLSLRPKDRKKLIESLKEGKAYIEDLKKTVKKRPPYAYGEGINVMLPLLVYYGGSAINTRFDKKLKLPYHPGWFQPYAHALEPNRFDFAEFFSWALKVEETAPHQWILLKRIVLEVINPPGQEKSYTDLQIEAQELVLLKNMSGGEPQKVKLPQLSAGEKNILALVADLVKRAIQLNPHLVPQLDIEDEREWEKEIENIHFTAPVPGIVLIDEIDLHLHPKWQRGIVPKLTQFFPEVQFVISTHSPFVLQSANVINGKRIDDNMRISPLLPSDFPDYESIVKKHFDIDQIFSAEIEEKLKTLRYLKKEIKEGKRKKDDKEFKDIIKSIVAEGEEYKLIVAFEISQL